MPLTKSPSKEAFRANVAAERNAGKPRNQSLAIAYRVMRDAKKGYAAGGGTPFYVRSEAHGVEHAGMIHSPVAGRTDRIPIGVGAKSYVIPADIVSGLGQGNSMAGANGLNKLLRMGPYGASASGTPKTMTPKMGAMPRAQKMFADGGEAGNSDGQTVPIVVAGAEFVVPPHVVEEIGSGDANKGHEILDAFVKHVRKKTIKTLKKLPGPKRN